MYSTAEDLLHLYQRMLNDEIYEGHRYLSPFSVHSMTEAHPTGIHPVGWMRGADYGLAWEVVTDPLGELAGNSKGTYGHGGAFGTQGLDQPKAQSDLDITDPTCRCRGHRANERVPEYGRGERPW